jgi:hypothetical protein
LSLLFGQRILPLETGHFCDGIGRKTISPKISKRDQRAFPSAISHPAKTLQRTGTSSKLCRGLVTNLQKVQQQIIQKIKEKELGKSLL